MLSPSAFLSRRYTLSRRLTEHAFFACYGRGNSRFWGVYRSSGVRTSTELTKHVIDFCLNFIALPLKMMQRIFENRRILICFCSCHQIS